MNKPPNRSNYEFMLAVLDRSKCVYCEGSGYITLSERPEIKVICIVCQHIGITPAIKPELIIKNLLYYNDFEYRIY